MKTARYEAFTGEELGLVGGVEIGSAPAKISEGPGAATPGLLELRVVSEDATFITFGASGPEKGGLEFLVVGDVPARGLRAVPNSASFLPWL